MANKPLVNRVAKSGIITLNLKDHFPKGDIAVFDLHDYLFRGLILREKDFRAAVAEHDWAQYQDQHLAVHCSTDAIVPIWAYQLVTISAAPYAKGIRFGSPEDYIIGHYYDALKTLNMDDYQDQRIVIKGCSDHPVPVSAYMELARLLTPVAKRIMYGEPCSMVPLFKKKSS